MSSGVYKVMSVQPGDFDHAVINGVAYQHRAVIAVGPQRFYALQVGVEGRGRTRSVIPIVNCPAPAQGNLRDFNIRFIRLRQEQAGWIGEKMPDDSAVSGSLVLLDTNGGFRGVTEEPAVIGHAKVIGTGWRAQGASGRSGRYPEVMIIATGPARVEWHRAGCHPRDPADWVAWTNDGIYWACMDVDVYRAFCKLSLIPDAVMRLGQGQA